MDYRAYDPPDDLSDFIRCFWTLQAPAGAAPTRQRIVPDGCMEMIFHCGDLYRQYRADGTAFVQPRCFVFGQVVHPLEIEPTGGTDIFAVRFEVDGFTPFSDRPLSSLADMATEVADRVQVNRRRLERRFSSDVGLSPKQLARIVRLQACSGPKLLSQADWLVGQWENRTPRGTIMEEWSQAGPNEVLRFENPSHDFPQVISYRRIGADSLMAEVSGTINGEGRSVAFPMRRVDED